MVSPFRKSAKGAEYISRSGKWLWDTGPDLSWSEWLGFKFAWPLSLSGDRKTKEEGWDEALKFAGADVTIQDARDARDNNEPFYINANDVDLYLEMNKVLVNADKISAINQNLINNKVALEEIYKYPDSWKNSLNKDEYLSWNKNQKAIQNVVQQGLSVIGEVPKSGSTAHKTIYGTQELISNQKVIGEVDPIEFLENFENSIDDTYFSSKKWNLDTYDHTNYVSKENFRKDSLDKIFSGVGKVGALAGLDVLIPEPEPGSFREKIQDRFRDRRNEFRERNDWIPDRMLLNPTSVALENSFDKGYPTVAPADSITRTDDNINPDADFLKSLSTYFGAARNEIRKQNRPLLLGGGVAGGDKVPNVKKALEGLTEIFEGTANIARPLQALTYRHTDMTREPISKQYLNAIAKDEKERGTFKKGWEGSLNRNDKAIQMAIDNGDIAWGKELATDIATDPIELIPGIGMYGAATRVALRGTTKAVVKLSTRPDVFSKVVNHIAIPDLVAGGTTFGSAKSALISNPTTTFDGLQGINTSTKVDMKMMIPTIKNIFTRNPTLNKELVTEQRVRLTNILENELGIDPKETDTFVNIITNLMLRGGLNPDTALDSLTIKGFNNYNYKSFDINESLILPNRYYKQKDGSYIPFTREGEILKLEGHPIFINNMVEAFDEIDKVSKINRINIEVINNKKTFSISKGPLNLIGKIGEQGVSANGILTSAGSRNIDIFKKIGLRIHDDEIYHSGIVEHLKDLEAQGITKISADDIQKFINDTKLYVISSNSNDIYGWTNSSIPISYASTPGPIIDSSVTKFMFSSKTLDDYIDPLTGKPVELLNPHYSAKGDTRKFLTDPARELPNYNEKFISNIDVDNNLHLVIRIEKRFLIDDTGKLVETHHVVEGQADHYKEFYPGGELNKTNELFTYLVTGTLDTGRSRFSIDPKLGMLKGVTISIPKWKYYPGNKRHVPNKDKYPETTIDSTWASKQDTTLLSNTDPRQKALLAGNGYAGNFSFQHFPKIKSIKNQYFADSYTINSLDQMGDAFLDVIYNDAIKPFGKLLTESIDPNIITILKSADTRNIINEKIFTVTPEQFLNLVFKDVAIRYPKGEVVSAINKDSIKIITDVFSDTRFTSGSTSPLYVHVKHLAAQGESNSLIELDIGFINGWADKAFRDLQPEFVRPLSNKTPAPLSNDLSFQLIDFFPKGVLKRGDNPSIDELLDQFKVILKSEMFQEILGGNTYIPQKTKKVPTYSKVMNDTSGVMFDGKTVIWSRQQIRDGKSPARIKKFSEGYAIVGPSGNKHPAFDYRDSYEEAITDAYKLLNEYRSTQKPRVMGDVAFIKSIMGIGFRSEIQQAALNMSKWWSISSKEELKARWYGNAPYNKYKFGTSNKTDGEYITSIRVFITGLLESAGYNMKGKNARELFSERILATTKSNDKSRPVDFLKPDEHGESQIEEMVTNYFNGINETEPVFELVGSNKLTKTLDELVFDRDYADPTFPFDDTKPTNTLDEFNHELESQIGSMKMGEDIDTGADIIRAKDIDEANKLNIIIDYLDWLTRSATARLPETPLNDIFSLRQALEHFSIPKKFLNKRNRGNYSQEEIINYMAIKASEFFDTANTYDSYMYDTLELKPRNIEGQPGIKTTAIDLDADLRSLFGEPTDRAGKKLDRGAYKTLGDVLRNKFIRLNKSSPESGSNGSVLGWTDFKNDGSTAIRILKSGDFNTLIHEGGHYIRRILLNETDLEDVGRTIMGDKMWDDLPDKHIWTVEAEEIFANQLEIYIKTGQAKRGLARIFDRIINFLKTFYRSIKGTPQEKEFNPELKKFFDEFIDIGRPSEEKILSSLPTHEHASALKFFGYENNIIHTPILPSNIAGVSLHDVANYADNQTETILYKIEDDHFTEIRGTIKSSEEARNKLPWDQYKQWAKENIDEEIVELEQLPDLHQIESVITSNFIVDNWQKIVQLPGLKDIFRQLNPNTAARNPLLKALLSLNRLQSQSKTLAGNAMTQLTRLGPSSKVFGGFDEFGSIAEGPLKGFNVNDIRSAPLDPRWRNLLNEEQLVWIRTAESLERAKLAMLKAEGIDIRILTEDEGGDFIYGGRRVFMWVDPKTGKKFDAINMGKKPKPGAKAAFEKQRYFETMEEAIEAGYRYLPDEETLSRNIEAAYNRVANERFKHYILNNVVATTRTGAAPGKIKVARDLAAARLERIKALGKQLQQTKRGESIHQSTLRSLKNTFPELAGRLDDVSKLSLDDLIKAGKKAGNQPISMVPDKQHIKNLFKQRLQIETQIKALEKSGIEVPEDLIKQLNTIKKKHWWHNMAWKEAYKSFEEGKGFKYTFELSAKSILMEPRIGLIDELIDIVQGTAIPGSKRKRGGMIQEAYKESKEAQRKYTIATDRAGGIQIGEGTPREIPAFQGRIFTRNQPDSLGGLNGQEVSELIVRNIIGKTEGVSGRFAGIFRATDVAAAAFKFFVLGLDASVFTIQLFFLMGESFSSPQIFPNAIKGYLAAMVNPQYQASFISKNRKTFANFPDVITSPGGQIEVTDFVRTLKEGSFNRYRPIKFGKAILADLYSPFQRGFEGALDSVAADLIKAHEHLAVDDRAVREISDYINQIRGLSDSARLGVGEKQRMAERLLLLAPQYGRSIAALIADLLHPSLNTKLFTPGLATDANLRVQLTRRAVARSFSAWIGIFVASGLALGMDLDEIAERLNPRHPKFMTLNVFGTEITLAGKTKSVLRLFGRLSITAEEGNAEGSMSTIAKWGRGNLSYPAQSATTILTGKTYMGERIYGDGVTPWDGAKVFAKDVFPGPLMGPLWFKSVLYEGGNVVNKGTRAITEFMGFNTYPEGSWQILKDWTKNHLDMDYEDFEGFERKIAREILNEKLNPILLKRVQQGDKTAQYFLSLDELDERRFNDERNEARMYSYREGPYGVDADVTIQLLRQRFSLIQERFIRDKAELAQQFDMFQDDVEYDEDDPEKFILSEWYNTYVLATDPVTDTIDFNKLQNIQNEFWNKTLPNGKTYNDVGFGYVRRNTRATSHPEEYMISELLSGITIANINQSQSAREKQLNKRRGWAQAFDKYGYSLDDFRVWKKEYK